jgi:UDP-glucose 4-epimerase
MKGDCVKFLVTGGAGCIGSDLVARLLKEGHIVTVYDDFSTGKEEHLEGMPNQEKLTVVRGDIVDFENLLSVTRGKDAVFHLAANSTVKYTEGAPTDPDLRLNIVGTYNVLEAMRRSGVKKIAFASTSAVYGDTPEVPSSETAPLMPISLYGASKAACEHLIQGFCSMFGMQGWIFRFANIVGGKSRKSGTMAITDFINKLRANPDELEILGDGKQTKSYMTNQDCIDAMLFCFVNAQNKVNVFNLGTGDEINVDELAQSVVEEMGLRGVKFRYTGGDRGWVGDMPKAILDVKKLNDLGWSAKHRSKEAVRLAIRAAIAQNGGRV